MAKGNKAKPAVRVPQGNGACAQVWAFMAKHRDASTDAVRAWATKRKLNIGNALQERAAFNRYHGV